MEKRGDALRYHRGIKNLNKKTLVDQFQSKNATVKNIHIDIIAPNSTTFYRRILKIFKIMFFMDGAQKKKKLSRKVITHSSFAVFYL